MSKRTVLATFIPGETPPVLGVDVEWHDDYTAAINSTAMYSGYFKPPTAGGLNNIMIFSDVPVAITEIDISETGSFASTWVGDAVEVRVSGNPGLTNVDSVNPLTTLHAMGTSLAVLPNMANNSEVRVDGNGMDEAAVTALFQPLVDGGVSNVIIENNGNADIPAAMTTALESAGGTIWETDSGYVCFECNASAAVGFQMHVSAGADVDWYVDDVLEAADTNNVTIFFTGTNTKKVQVRGVDVANASYILLGSKQLVGRADLSAMTNSEFRFDFSGNPNLTEVVLPKTDGIFDQLMGYGTGITNLRLDLLPGLVNSNSIQIRLGDCPNLDADSVAQNILLIDTNVATGRQFWVNGTTPALDTDLYNALIANNWTVVL